MSSNTRARSLPWAALPLSSNASAAAPKRTVVVTEIGARVSERLDWWGRIRRSSRFPQYFTSAMFGCARAVAVWLIVGLF